VPRLLLLMMMRLIATDFRVGMYFNVFSSSLLALGMILTARRIRGSSSYLDVFFPIAVMHWGQAINFLWCWQVQYSASILLVGGVLMLIARARTPPNLLPTLAVGMCVVLLPLCGANGLGLAPSLALWLAYITFLQWRSPTIERRRNATITAGFAVAALLSVGLYFIDYHSPPYLTLTHSIRVIVRAAAQFLTMGFGPGIVGLSFDRSPMWFWKFVTAAVIALFFTTAGLLLKTWWRSSNETARAAGLFLFLAGMASLAFGLGMGRAGFETRYVTLSIPGLCAVYLVWTIYGAARLQTIVRTALVGTVLVTFLPNTLWGLHWAYYLKSHLAGFERDIKAGAAPYQLLQSYADLHQDRELMIDYMPMLRGTRVGAFRYLRDNPPFHEISLPLLPVDMHNVTWKEGNAQPTGADAWLTFTLPVDIQAAGIQLTYSYSNVDDIEPHLGICWKSSGETDFEQDSCTGYFPFGDRANWRHGTWSRLNSKVTLLHAWMCHPVQTVRLLAFENGTIKIEALTVLVAEDGTR
jgi:hypothetical protein